MKIKNEIDIFDSDGKTKDEKIIAEEMKKFLGKRAAFYRKRAEFTQNRLQPLKVFPRKWTSAQIFTRDSKTHTIFRAPMFSPLSAKAWTFRLMICFKALKRQSRSPVPEHSTFWNPKANISLTL